MILLLETGELQIIKRKEKLPLYRNCYLGWGLSKLKIGIDKRKVKSKLKEIRCSSNSGAMHKL